MTGTPSTHPGLQRWTTILDGGRLKELRRQRGLSRGQLATVAGISLTTMRRLDLPACRPLRVPHPRPPRRRSRPRTRPPHPRHALALSGPDVPACMSSATRQSRIPSRRPSGMARTLAAQKADTFYLADGREDPAAPVRRVRDSAVPGSLRSPHARPPPAASPPVHLARRPGRPRRRGLAAQAGPLARGQRVAADRPAHHPASTPAQAHRQASCTPGWITMTTTQSPPRAAQRWTTVLDGHQLRRLRQQRGLSQERLASQAGISLTAVTRLERQPCAPCRCRTLGRLAAALGEQPGALSPDGQA